MSTKNKPSRPLQERFINRFKENKPGLIAFYVLAVLTIIAVLAPLLANERPLYMKYMGENYFPAFTGKKNYVVKNTDGTSEKIQLDITDWKKMKMESVVWAPVSYSPGIGDYNNASYLCPRCNQKFMDGDGNVSEAPPRFRHWLGTGHRGDDLLAGLIHGTRISLTIGFLSMGIATLIGILFGALAGYFGNSGLSTTRGRMAGTFVGVFFAWFYAFSVRADVIASSARQSGSGFVFQLLISILIFLVVVWFFSFAGKLAGRLPWLSKRISIPADTLISRIMEIMLSLPLFMLILTVAALSRPSLVNMMVLIGLTNWTGIARLTRAEMLRVRQQDYIQSATALGMSQFRIFTHHAIPNAIAPALVAVSFGIADAILIESALSFLGIGVPANVTTWGSLLSAGYGNFSAWWLVVFPGLCIFITVTSYNLIGEALRDALDPKMKR